MRPTFAAFHPRLRVVTFVSGLALGVAFLSGCGAEGVDSSPIGVWRNEANPDVTLTIEDDGTVSGSDGCNRIVGGTATVKESRVEFGALATTMMFCEGVDTWLSQAASGQSAGGVLTISDAAGAEIGTLVRAS